VKLLRAIQEGEVEPVGARKAVKVDVRIVSATNRDLIADVKKGRFREDLFYRLHVFPITVPPLRERPADIPALARHFLALFAAEEGKPIRAITPDAAGLLTAYHWPGNIRQLENAVFRAVVLAEGDSLGINEFPQISAQLSGDGRASDTEAMDSLPLDQPAETLVTAVPVPERLVLPSPPAIPPDALSLLDRTGDVRPLEEVEAELIRYAVTHYRGQMSEVARKLQIGRSTLYRKLEALGLHSGGGDGGSEGVAGERQPRKIA
jgi:DNA-binding NtrC family response regulator